MRFMVFGPDGEFLCYCPMFRFQVDEFVAQLRSTFLDCDISLMFGGTVNLK